MNDQRARVLLLVLMAFLAAPASSEDKPPNLLKNGGFEEATKESVPPGWAFATPEVDKAQSRLVTDKAPEGKAFVRLTGTAQWAAVFQKVPIDRAKTYTLTGRLRVNRGGYALIKIDYFQGDQWLGQTGVENAVQGQATDWKTTTATSKLADFPNATHISATVAIAGDTDADFDDLSLTAK